MILTLSINLEEGQNEAEKEITIEEGSITIGRSTNNTLCLPDPDKVISGLHATITCQNGLCTVTDKSTNGTYLNDEKEAVGRANSADLKNGDYLFIGQYTLNVAIEQDAIDKKSVIDIDTDLTSLFGEDKHETESGIFDTLTIRPKVEAEDSEEKLPSLTWLNGAFPIPVEEESIPSTDPFPEEWDKMPKTELPFPPQQPSPAPKSKKPKQPAITTDTEWQQAVAQFLAGAELPPSSPVASQISNETFFTIGQLLKASVYGTKEVLSSRTEIKNEMRLDVTMIRPTSNNPIKQALGGKDALQRLLLPQESGYLTADQAMNEAFNDIKAHQIAVLAGMQEALQSVLKRFAPEVLTERLERYNPIGANIPIHRQAKLWELFVQLYEDIIQEEESNFNQLFGSTFSETYEKQTATFKQQDKQNNP